MINLITLLLLNKYEILDGWLFWVLMCMWLLILLTSAYEKKNYDFTPTKTIISLLALISMIMFFIFGVNL